MIYAAVILSNKGLNFGRGGFGISGVSCRLLALCYNLQVQVNNVCLLQ